MAYVPLSNTFFRSVPKKHQSTELGVQEMLSKFCRENGLALTAENKRILRDGITKEFDDYFSVENLRFVMRKHSTEFIREPKKLRVIPRTVSVEEMQSMFKTILSANPWIADTEKNGELIAATFLDSEAMSPKRNLQDMIKAVEIVKNQLDRTPPPTPPKPQYAEEKPLDSWQLPLDAPTWMQTRATREQQRDLVQRLRKFESWKKQNEQ